MKYAIVVCGYSILYVLFACSTKTPTKHLYGEAQGTTYSIKYISHITIDKQDIDSILWIFDSLFSVYKPNSVISRFNRGEDILLNKDWKKVFLNSLEVHRNSKGKFNPLYQSCIKGKPCSMDSMQRITDSAGNTILVNNTQFILNFDAIAQGYAVDKIALFFDKKGIDNYMIELGGEIRTKGIGKQKNGWIIGIEKPQKQSTNRVLHASFQSKNNAIATSGNYRKTTQIKQKTVGHIINPTNLESQTNILSATVLAQDCLIADAMATTIMTMSHNEAIDFFEKYSEKYNMHLYMIYVENNTEKIFHSTHFPKTTLF